MKHRLALLAALALVLLAGGLRVHRAQARRSLWGDEAQELGIIKSSPDLAALTNAVRRDGHPPLHYVIEWSVYRAYGEQFVLARWLQVFCGTLAVATVMWLAWSWFGWRCALLTGLIAATSPFLIFYSSELRSYALLSVLAPLYGLAFLRFMDRREYRGALLWGAAAAVLAYCHYFAFFVILASGFHALIRDHSRKGWLRVVIAGTAFCVVYLPWLPSLFWSLGNNSQPWGVPLWDPLSILRTLKNPVGSPAVGILLFSLVAGFFHLRPKGSDSRETLAFTALVVTGLGGTLIAWIFQWFRGGIATRYLIAHTMLLLPAACVYWSRMGSVGDAIVWRGLRTGRLYRIPARWHAVVGIALLLLAIPMTSSYRFRFLECPISGCATVAAQIENLEQPGDRIVVDPSWELLAFCHHYQGALPLCSPPYEEALPWLDHVDRLARSRDTPRIKRQVRGLLDHLREGGRVWVVVGSAYPTERRIVLDPDLAPDVSSPLGDAEFAIHLELLRALYRNGKLAYRWVSPSRKFRHPTSLLRFDPRDE